MPNILDYVVWRGDLSFKKSKFNCVDAAVFSQIIFLDLTKSVAFRSTISLSDCADKHFSHVDKSKPLGLIIPIMINDLFSLMANSKRFGNVLLSNYKKDIDHSTETQFSALTAYIEEINTKVVIFSGTDDTIIGWKEDFNMIFKTPTEAQIQSVKYLNKVCSNFDGKIVVLGHSKGGNLSIYSSANCKESIRKNIVKIYNFDGPGIPDCNEAENLYSILKKKLITVVPQASIVGRLFEQNDDHYIVHSVADGVYQHDVLTWQVKGTAFIPDTEFLPDAVGVGNHLRTILSSLSPEKREAFVEATFKLLFSTGAKTLTDLSKKMPNLFKQYFKLTKEERKAINGPMIKLIANKYIRKCFLNSSKSYSKHVQNQKKKQKTLEKKKPLK